MHPPTMVATVVPRPLWCLTPGAATYIHQPTCWVTVMCGGAGNGAPCRPPSTIKVTTRLRLFWGCSGPRVIHRITWESVPDIWQCHSRQGEEEHIPVGIGAISLAAYICQIGRCAASSKQGHHGGMLREGGVKTTQITNKTQLLASNYGTFDR